MYVNLTYWVKCDIYNLKAPPVGGVLNAYLSTGRADRTPDAKQDMYVETGSKAMAKKLTMSDRLEQVKTRRRSQG
jgi:hypothetical protein